MRWTAGSVISAVLSVQASGQPDAQVTSSPELLAALAVGDRCGVVSSSTRPGDAATSVALVHQLVAEQFPRWRFELIQPIVSSGTDHDIFRMGTDLVVRLPRRGWASEQGRFEAEWLPRLAPQLPLAIPTPLALGEPAHGYPFRWSVHGWIPGVSADTASVDLDVAAVDLAGFVLALRGIATTGAPSRLRGRRGCPLAEADSTVRNAIRELGDTIDPGAVTRSWEESLAAAVWSQDDVWVHGDLLPGNLLALDGRLSAVIDFGGLNVGDPSCDLQAGWAMLDDQSRTRFRRATAADDQTWLRGRGWALCHAVTALAARWPDPSVAVRARRTLRAVLGDVSAG